MGNRTCAHDLPCPFLQHHAAAAPQRWDRRSPASSSSMEKDNNHVFSLVQAKHFVD